MHHACSKSAHNTGTQNEIFWNDNTQTISSSTSLTRWLPAYDIFVLRFWPKK